MPLQFESSRVGGDVVVIKPAVLDDDRGFFMGNLPAGQLP